MSSTNLAEKINESIPEPGSHTSKVSLRAVPNKKKIDPLDVVLNRKVVRTHVKEFAQLFALIGFISCIYILLKHYSLASAGAALITGLCILAVGYLFPRLLLGTWEAWMKLGIFLQVTTTYPIVLLLWIVVAVPSAMLVKLAGKILMDMSFRTDAKTYWLDVKAEKNSFKLLERQF